MRIGIHVQPDGNLEDREKRFEEILNYNNIDIIRLDSNKNSFWSEVKKLDFYIHPWVHFDIDRIKALSILPIIENEYKVPCFPNHETYWHFDDKIRQYYLMKANDFPMADCYVFWDKQKAISWIAEVSFPIVFKLKGGAGSKNVFLLKNKSEAISAINIMFDKGVIPNKLTNFSSVSHSAFESFKRYVWESKSKIMNKSIPYRRAFPDWIVHKNYILFQKFLPNNTYDTRVTIIGNKAFAFRRFNRPNDFRSSGSGLIDYDYTKIDDNFIKKGFEISNKMNFQSMAYDFLYDNNEVSFCEISYAYQDVNIHACPGYWDNHLKWHEGNYWPQYMLLKSFLNKSNLKQPNSL